MADIRAIANGNWSNPAIWAPNPPAAGDVVRPNNFTVTIDVSVSVTEIRNDAGGGAVAGGSFNLNAGLTVNSNIIAGQANAASGHIIKYSSVGTSTINGTVTNVSTNATYLAIQNSGSGTLNINGDVIFTQNNGTVLTAGLIENTSNGVINITGTVNGNTLGANRAQCVVNVSTGTVNIVGNVNSPVAGALFFTVVNISTGTITINGNINSTAATTIDNRSSGTVTISGGTYSSSGGVILTNTSGTVTITGLNITSNTTATVITNSGNITINANIVNNSPGVAGTFTMINNSGTISIIGNVAGPNSVNNSTYRTIANTGTINITGNVNAGTATQGGSLSSSFTIFNTNILNITGTINSTTSSTLGTITNCNAVRNQNGTVNIIGNCIGGIGGTIVSLLSGVFNEIGTINITGNAIGGSTGLAVANTSTGTVTVNGNAIGGTAYQAIEGSNAAGNTIIEKAIYSNLGQSPTIGFIKFKDTNPQVEILNVSNNKITLYDVNQVSGLMPSISNVRSGTTYSNGTLTGTLAVPNPNSVLLGVATDNTTGTLLMTPGDFWNYLISNGFTGGSIGERLKNASTVDTTGAQIAGFIV